MFVVSSQKMDSEWFPVIVASCKADENGDWLGNG
jgi:hypothetical protein